MQEQVLEDHMAQQEHKKSHQLAELVETKQSRLAVSADHSSANAILELADQVGSEIVILKTHVDIIEDFSWDFVTRLKALAEKHHFLIFEDRKFADIGTTVELQCGKGVYQIAEWADIINAHSLPGPGIVDGLRRACEGHDVGLLLLAHMSSQGNLFDQEYVDSTVRMAEANDDFVMGFIAQSRVSERKEFWHMTPGVQLEAKAGSLGQQYRTPAQARKDGSDIIIVGRGIYGADEPAKVAAEYRVASL